MFAGINFQDLKKNNTHWRLTQITMAFASLSYFLGNLQSPVISSQIECTKSMK